MSLTLRLKKSFGDFSLDLSLAVGDDLSVLLGPSGEAAGASVALAGGVDGDGEDDVAVGASIYMDVPTSAWVIPGPVLGQHPALARVRGWRRYGQADRRGPGPGRAEQAGGEPGPGHAL